MRVIDRLFGWKEITTVDGTKRLTDYLLMESVPAEVTSDENGTAVRIGAQDAKRVERYLTENGIAARVGPIRGLPAFFRAAAVRPGILLALAAVAFLFFFARSRVWDVRITGDGSIDEDTVRAALYEAGLRPGMRKKDVSIDRISSVCLSNGELFSAVNLSLSGVVAVVEWIGRSGVGQTVTCDRHGVNLVASCDGVIVSVEPISGTAVVAPGQTVKKGDLLISGVIPGGTVRAAGKVMARVTESFTATAAKSETKQTTLKRRPVSFSFRTFGEEVFSIGGGGDTFAVREWTLPGGVVLPFSLRVGYARETVTETVERTEAETAEVAIRRLHWIIREALSEGELLKKEVAGAFDGSGYTATAMTEYLLNIAEPLAFNRKIEYNK